MKLAITEQGRRATSGKVYFRPEHSFDFNLLLRLELGGPATIEELEEEMAIPVGPLPDNIREDYLRTQLRQEINPPDRKGNLQKLRSSTRRLFEAGLVEDIEKEED